MTDLQAIDEAISHSVIGAFFEVYNTLGEGFLEHVYALALEQEIRGRGHRVAREFAAPVPYKGRQLAVQRLDMVVDSRVVVEIKATHELHPSAKRQLFNYLRATNLEVGLLLHFGPKPRVYRQIATHAYRGARGHSAP
jgi:GxxExxY protein